MISSRLPAELSSPTRSRARSPRSAVPAGDRHRSDRDQSDRASASLSRGSARAARRIRAALDYDPQPLGLWSARGRGRADFRRRGIVISADRVALTSSTSEAYALLFKLLCDAGDAVLVPQPSYPLFEHLTRLESVTRDSVRARVSRRVADRHRLDRRAPLDRSRRGDPGRVAEQSRPDRSCTRTISRRSSEICAAARSGDHRRRGVCRLSRSIRRPTAAPVLAGARRADLQPRRPVEVRRAAAAEARVDRLRRAAGRASTRRWPPTKSSPTPTCRCRRRCRWPRRR